MASPQKIPSTKVELSVSARKLVDVDVFSKSDPMCVLFIKAPGSDEYREHARTEMIMDNLNPEFVKKFTMDYFFEERQYLKFEMYDIDSKDEDLQKHDFLGRMMCSLGEIMNNGKLTKSLEGPKKNSGDITVRGTEKSNCKDLMTLTFKGVQLDQKDRFGKSDPYLTFRRLEDDDSFTICHRTEVIKNTLSPTWREFSVMLSSFCGGDYDRRIEVKCWDWNRMCNHELIGTFETTVRKLSKGPCDANKYELIHPDKLNKGNYKNSGLIILKSVEIKPQFTFEDFVMEGCRLSFTIAIDFSQSNGDPQQPTSLHYINPDQPNHYLRILRALGSAIEDHCGTDDIMISALGFGAKIPPDWNLSQEFFLNVTTNPECRRIGGVIEAYEKAIRTVQLFGPSHFAPIINNVASYASQKRDGSVYHVLLMVTDGGLNDLTQTKRAILEADKLPMSIILVGVGDDDFSNIEELQGERMRKGENVKRDFVEFIRFHPSKSGENMRLCEAQLANEVLAKIPDHLVSFMKMFGIRPGKGSTSTEHLHLPDLLSPDPRKYSTMTISGAPCPQ